MKKLIAIEKIKGLIQGTLKERNEQPPISEYDDGWSTACNKLLEDIEIIANRKSYDQEIIEYLKAKQTIAEYERNLGDTTGVRTECVTLNLHQVNQLLEIIEDE